MSAHQPHTIFSGALLDHRTNSDFRALLADVSYPAPAKVSGPLDNIVTGEPVSTYDRADARVSMVHAFAQGWFAASGLLIDADAEIDLAVSERAGLAAFDQRYSALLDLGYTVGVARDMARSAAA